MVNGEDYDPWRISQTKFQGYMKAKMENHDEQFKNLSTQNIEQDLKIGSLEKSRSKFTGALVVLTFVWGVIVLVFNKFKGGG